ncbi:leucine-rich repeat family protein [Vigna unguiculata]|uniref:Leucine-rich repeat family protein n=1 Tax=Vigna unguiculata TaxID=3917 RepID=A0A4D6MK85_VIGUN|nr:leucine-rich repeat family protein [Vigna unguiculata]
MLRKTVDALRLIRGSLIDINGNLSNWDDGNQLTGELPEELGFLPKLNRLQIDQNNITGPIPLSFAKLNTTQHFQLDNNNFGGNSIPGSYANMSTLIKLSLRNCNLQGPIPDLSTIPQLTYVDLSLNQLNESIPTNKLSDNITTIDLSNNNLIGTIPSYFSSLSRLKSCKSIANNSLNGSVPSTIWQERILNGSEMLSLDMQNNQLTSISGSTNLPPNVTLWLEGNPMCPNNNTLVQVCGSKSDSSINGFSDFRTYMDRFQRMLSSGLKIDINQLYINQSYWEEGPRLEMNLKIFPILHSPDPYKDVILSSPSSGISKGALAGIVLGAIAFGVTFSAIITILILRKRLRYHRTPSKRTKATRISKKFEGIRSFYYEEMASATNKFSDSAQIGQGGYGRVFKGLLPDGTVVAIKRAQEGSLQEGEQILVDEYMPNGTLKDHLSAYSEKPLTFSMRLKIALGSAKGLLYLHTEVDPPIFHRDVKATNILLDSKFTAKVSDFGLSRIYCDKGDPGKGYVDPDYFSTRKFTEKSDVYSLGVVFLELVTGRPPIFHGENIIRQCCKDTADERPKMAEVARELENMCSMLPETKAVEAEYGTNGSGRKFSSQPSSSSSSTSRTPFVSEDVSGSDLISGKIPTIRPR